MSSTDELTAQLHDCVGQAFDAGKQAGKAEQLTDDGYRRNVALGMVADVLGVVATRWLRADSQAAQIVADAGNALAALGEQPHPAVVQAAPPPGLPPLP